MPIHDHSQSALGRVALWGGDALGLLLAAGLFTGGFGLAGRRRQEAPDTPLMRREGERIVVPEGPARPSVKSPPTPTGPTGPPSGRSPRAPGLTLRAAYALDMFRSEGLTPDAEERVEKFFTRPRGGGS